MIEYGCIVWYNLDMFVKLTREEFLDRCYAIHGDTYDYSKVVYVNDSTKIEIICKVHGSFIQLASSHIYGRASNGHSCMGCRADGRRSTREGFLDKCYAIHGDLYDYSEVVYVNSNTKVEIICKVHGSFWQRANSHLRGNGCPKCAYATKAIIGSQLYAEVPTTVYYIHVVDPCGDYWKVGITRNELSRRFGKTTLDNHLNVVWTYEFESREPAWMFEQFILHKFNGSRVYNPDISVINDGLTEMFRDDVASDKDSLYAEYLLEMEE
jgi:hypothetical protein